jgi:hypothetical protein
MPCFDIEQPSGAGASASLQRWPATVRLPQSLCGGYSRCPRTVQLITKGLPISAPSQPSTFFARQTTRAASSQPIPPTTHPPLIRCAHSGGRTCCPSRRTPMAAACLSLRKAASAGSSPPALRPSLPVVFPCEAPVAPLSRGPSCPLSAPTMLSNHAPPPRHCLFTILLLDISQRSVWSPPLLPLAAHRLSPRTPSSALGRVCASDKAAGSWDGDEGLGTAEGTLEGYLESYRNRMLAGKVRPPAPAHRVLII